MATPATTPIEHLSAITLQTVKAGKEIEAPELWKENGAVIMVVHKPGCDLCRQEAAELASLKPQFDAKKVALYAVVHEKLGVPEFKYFFEGKVLFDPKRGFYGPEERWSSSEGLFVIGPGDQGILFEHRERHRPSDDRYRATAYRVLEAVEKIKQS